MTSTFRRPAGRVRALAAVLLAATGLPLLAAGPAHAATASGAALVVYDTSGAYGYLGELYAEYTANLASHFGTVKAEPVSAYTAGQVDSYTATIYLGSSYAGTPADFGSSAFLTDVAATPHPVLWMGYNIWDLASSMGAPAFTARYGWDASTSYVTQGVNEVDYNGKALTRNAAAGDIVQPNIVAPSQVTVLAQAKGTASDGSALAFPWAIRSAGLTYVDEVPISYATETDRVIAFEDLLFSELAPNTVARHRALVRLEDIDPTYDTTTLRNIADWLYSQHVPFSFGVIPEYLDPNGYYNNGTPQTVKIAKNTAFVTTIKYLQSHGGTMVDHGFTHQYGKVANPYTGVTGDDFEFFRAHLDGTDQNTSNVIYDGPVAEDSASWAQNRVNQAKKLFTGAGLTAPSIWETPHYAASATDYKVFASSFPTKYERGLYYAGQLSGGPIDSSRYIGQFFPYVCTDVYGQKVLPEDLGNYEPQAYNGHPPRLPADLVHEADLNLAVRDGFASFFYHPYLGLDALQQIVTGIQNLGYTFVAPTSL